MRRVTRAWGGMAVLLLMLTCGSAQAADPVAMVTDLTGNAWLVKGGKQERLNILSYLYPSGGSLRLDRSASISITVFSPAAVYAVTGPAKLELVDGELRLTDGGKLPGTRLSPEKADAGRQFSAMQRERLAMAAYRMRGGGLELQSPVDIEVLSDRPVFSWVAPQGIDRFDLMVFDETTQQSVFESGLHEMSAELPAVVSLQRGHRYSWQVKATLPSGSKIESGSEFSIVEEARYKRITRLKPAAGAPFSEQVLYALMLESEGLNMDAADEWERLAAQRPDEQIISVHTRKK